MEHTKYEEQKEGVNYRNLIIIPGIVAIMLGSMIYALVGL